MTWFSKSKTSLDAFAEAVRPELAQHRTPGASAELRDRILADRAAGMRVILPGDRAARHSGVRYLVAAVLVIAALLTLPLYRSARDETRDVEPVTLFSYFGGVALAQVPSASHLSSPVPVYPERVRPGTLEYLRAWQDSTGRITKKVLGVLTLTAAGSDWRVAQTRRELSSSAGETAAETLLVARRDLRLVSRAVHIRPYRRWNGINIEQRITGDSVIGRMTLDGVKGMRPIAQHLPPAYAPYLSDVLAPVYFASIPLSRQWQGRVTLLGWAVVPNDVLSSVELRVTGEEQVQVPAGRFDCWKLDVRYAGGDFSYWIRKSDGIAVRLQEHQQDGTERIVTLERENWM